jgi:hypothetical protein
MLRLLQLLWKHLAKACCLLYYRISGKKYPKKILPKVKYLNAIDINEICNSHLITFIIRSDKPTENTFNDLENVRTDIFDPTKIAHLSMNLLGGFFIEEHIKFRPKMHTTAVEKWKGERVFLSDLINDYEELKIYSPIFYNGIHLNNINVPFHFDLTDRHAKTIVRKLLNKSEIEEKSFIAHGKLYSIHDPTNINYWHLELEIKDFNDPPKVVTKIKNMQEQSVARHIINDVLCVKGKTKMRIYPIDKNFYEKQKRKKVNA